MYQLGKDNPITSKIQKVKNSFKTQVKQKSTNSPSASSIVKKFKIDDSIVTPFTTRKTNGSISPYHNQNINSKQKIKKLQSKLQTQRQSINFYLSQLNRRQHQFSNKIEQIQNEYSQKMKNLQKLLKLQINKNIKLEEQISFLKESNAIQFEQNLLNYTVYSDNQLYILMIQVQKQLEQRHRNSLGLTRLTTKWNKRDTREEECDQESDNLLQKLI